MAKKDNTEQTTYIFHVNHPANLYKDIELGIVNGNLSCAYLIYLKLVQLLESDPKKSQLLTFKWKQNKM